MGETVFARLYSTFRSYRKIYELDEPSIPRPGISGVGGIATTKTESHMVSQSVRPGNIRN